MECLIPKLMALWQYAQGPVMSMTCKINRIAVILSKCYNK